MPARGVPVLAGRSRHVQDYQTRDSAPGGALASTLAHSHRDVHPATLPVSLLIFLPAFVLNYCAEKEQNGENISNRVQQGTAGAAS